MSARITRIDAVTISGTRRRPAGSNARLGRHGEVVKVPLVRLTTSDGVEGIGRSSAPNEHLEALLGAELAEVVSQEGVGAEWQSVELPLLDTAARTAGVPVDRFLGGTRSDRRVRTYDTSLYFDDLHLGDDAEAADLIANEARAGWEAGHRAFKIKVGRGARHMGMEAGTRRDIAIIRAVRDAVGPEAEVMIDANNGWNLNLTKRVLSETFGAGVFWVEEPFHEDNVLLDDLHEWIAREGLGVLIADGEGVAHPAVADWARQGLVDVLQYNIHAHGLVNWVVLGEELAALGRTAAPHTYGGGVTPHMVGTLALLTDAVEFIEWDGATFEAIDTSRYVIEDGWVTIPWDSGFGIEVVPEVFDAAVREDGHTLRA